MKNLWLLMLVLSFYGQNLAQISKNMVLFSNPPLEGSTFFSDVWGYEDKVGKEFAVIGTRTNIRVYEVTDPRNPVKVFDQPGGSSTSWRDFKTYRNYLYAVCDNCNEGLEIIPLDSLSYNIMHFRLSEFARAHNIYIDTSQARLYVVGARYYPTNSTNGVLIYDLTNPAKPQFLAYFNANNEYVHDIYVKDHIGIASSGYAGTRIYDFTNPSNPTLLMGSEIPLGVYHHSSWMHPDSPYVYSANEVPVGIPMQVYQVKNGSLINIHNFNEPLIQGSFNNVPHNPYVHEGKLFISYYEDGVQVYDLSKPSRPVKLAYYDTYPNTSYNGYNGCWGVYPYLRSGTILASDMAKGLMVLGLDLSVKATGSLHLTSPGSGFILRSMEKTYKVWVEDTGQIQIDTVTVPLDANLIHNQNMEAPELVLTSPSGNFFSLEYDTVTGVLTTQALQNAPTGQVVKMEHDVYFDDIYTGPVFTNNLERFKMRVIDGNQHFLKM